MSSGNAVIMQQKPSRPISYYASLVHAYRSEGIPVRQIQQRLLEVHGEKYSVQTIQRFFDKSSHRQNLSPAEWNSLAYTVIKKRLCPDNAEAEIDGIFISRKRLKFGIKRNVSLTQQDLMRSSLSKKVNMNESSIIASKQQHVIKVWPSLPEPLNCTDYHSTPFTHFSDWLSEAFSTTFNTDLIPDQAFGSTQVSARLAENFHLGSLQIPAAFEELFKDSVVIDSQSNQVFAEAVQKFMLDRYPNEFRHISSRNHHAGNLRSVEAIVKIVIFAVCNDLRESDFPRFRFKGLFNATTWPVLNGLFNGNKPLLISIRQKALIYACKYLDVLLLRSLISSGVDTNTLLDTDFGFLTPLTFCLHSDFGHREDADSERFLEALLCAGADPNIPCQCGCDKTGLQLALGPESAHGIIPLLIKHGAEVTTNLDIGSAIRNTQPCIEDLEALLHANSILAERTYRNGFSPALYAATLEADLDPDRAEALCRLLLAHGASVTTSPYSKKSPSRCQASQDPCLMLTLRDFQDDDIPCRLLSMGANPNICCSAWYAVWDNEDKDEPPWRSTDPLDSNPNSEVFRGWLRWNQGCGTYLPLQGAIASGSIGRVKLILKHGASLYCCHGPSPLVLAVQTGNLEMVQLFIELKADLNAASCNYDDEHLVLSPIAEAAARNHRNILGLLLEAGADVNTMGRKHGISAISAAILSGSQECRDLLLSMPAVDLMQPAASETKIDAITATILAEDYITFDFLIQVQIQSGILTCTNLVQMVEAAMRRNDYFLTRLLQVFNAHCLLGQLIASVARIEDLNRLIRHGLTMEQLVACRSFFAAEFWHLRCNADVELVRYVVESVPVLTTDLVQQICDSCAKYCFPFDRQILERVLLKLCHRISEELALNYRYGVRALTKVLKLCQFHAKLEHGRNLKPIVLGMLLQGVDLADFRCPCENQALYWACEAGDIDMLQQLLEYGLSSSRETSCTKHQKIWQTPFHIAAQTRSTSCISVLLRYPALVNIDFKSQLPSLLVRACECGHTEVAKVLVEHGAEINYPDDMTVDPLTIAARFGRSDLMSYLLHQGAKTCISTETRIEWQMDGCISNRKPAYPQCRTALQAASEHGHIDAVKILILHGADVNAQAAAENGVTALQAASIKGYGKICQILVEQGADIAAPASPIEGLTAIDGAVEFGRMDILKYLLDNWNGDEPIKEVHRKALKLAESQHQYAIVAMLQEYKEPNSK